MAITGWQKWLKWLSPRSRTVQRRSQPRRRPAVESLEDRTLLTVPGFVDAGDFYWADGQPIRLLRQEEELVVRLNSEGDLEEQLGTLTSSGGALAGWSTAQLLDADTAVLNLSYSGSSAGGLAGLEEVSWVAPVFFHEETSSRLIVTDEVVVALQPGVQPEAFFSDGFLDYRPLLGTPDQFVATLAAGGGAAALDVANQLHADPRVKWASPNFYQAIRLATNDPLFDSQWHLNNTGQTGARSDADADLEEAWAVTTGNNAIVVAVIDNGVQLNHPDLNIFTNVDEIAGNGVDDDGNGWVDDVHGWDFVDNDNDPSPTSAFDNHGTAVAGVAGAIGNNALGVTGAAQNIQILPIKIGTATSGSAGFISADRIATAIYYAAGRTADSQGTWRGADILNNSWGGGPPNSMLTAAFDWAASNGRGGLGVANFVAAGNDASGYKTFALNGLPAGNFIAEWRYTKNRNISIGNDTVWLGEVIFPDGSVERFDMLGLPSGWSTSGNAAWSVMDDPVHSYGTGRYVARAGAIGHNQQTRLRSPSFTGNGALIFRYWTSSQENFDGLTLWISANNGPFIQQSALLSGNPAVTTAVSYPARLASTIAVGASTDWDYRADYSQYGSNLDFVAPSSGGFAAITTTDRTGSAGFNAGDYTDTFGGTSSAAPLAAGIGALLLSLNPNLTATQIRDAMRASADKIGNVPYDSNGFNQFYGHGRVNAAAALAAITPDVSGPMVTGYSLATDTGTSNSDQITSDTTPVLTFTFNERTVWTAGDIVVKAPDNSTVTPVSSRGAGTRMLTLVLPTLTQDGMYTVNLSGSGSFSDQAGNKLNNGVDEVRTFTLDTTAPTALSITRQTPPGSPTNADTLVFRAIFDEDVTNVDPSDFAVNGTTTATVTNVNMISGKVYDVTVSGGNLANFNGVVGLNLRAAQNITDLAGNALPAGEPATDETYLVDNTAPTMTSFRRQPPAGSLTNADMLIFRATFSETVINVDPTDFAVNGTTTATVTDVNMVSGNVYDVIVSGGDLANFNGLVGLDLAAGQNITNLTGNALLAIEPATDETYVVDNTAPTLTSFTRRTPAASLTNADALIFRATFSETVNNVDTTDFVVNGTTTATVTGVNMVSGSVYDVTVSGGDLANFNGMVGLNLSGSQNIVDLVGNPLPAGEPATDETYVVDNTAPALASITRQAPATSPTNADTLVFRATFSENVINVGPADFVVNGTTTATVTDVNMVSGNVYEVTVSGGNLASFTGLVGLDLAAGQNITTPAGTPLLADEPASDETYTLDNAVPMANIVAVTPDPRTTPVDSITITFTEVVSGFDLSDLSLVRDGGANLLTPAQTLTTSDNVTWTLGNLMGLTAEEGDYTLTLTAAGSDITDAAGNALAASTSAQWTVDSTSPTADIVDVTPDPRNTIVGVVTIHFSEQVTGVDISDFTLTRDGANVDMSGLSVTEASPAQYTIDLSSVTGVSGDYVLTLTASGSGIMDAAGNLLTGDASDSWTVDINQFHIDLRSAPSIARPGQSIRLIAQVVSAPAGGIAAGTVTFFINNRFFRTVAVNSGLAEVSVSLPLGRHLITATFNGGLAPVTDSLWQLVGTTNARFVAKVYKDLTGKAGSSRFVATWSAALDSGQVNRTQVVLAIQRLTPSLVRLVRQAYRTHLRRLPQRRELQVAVNQLRSGNMSGLQLTASLMVTPEYLLRRGRRTSNGFLQAVIRDLTAGIGNAGVRNALVSRLQNQAQRLKSPSIVSSRAIRAQVVSALLRSSAGLESIVQGLFFRYLRQSADVRLATFVTLQRNGVPLPQIIAALMASDPYIRLV